MFYIQYDYYINFLIRRQSKRVIAVRVINTGSNDYINRLCSSGGPVANRSHHLKSYIGYMCIANLKEPLKNMYIYKL